MRIEPMTAQHAAAVLAIYQAGIDEGNATFETSAPPWPRFDAGHLPGHRFVAIDTRNGGPEASGTRQRDPGAGAAVAGWVAVSAASARPAYAGVVEHSVYVDPRYRGRGVGGQLLAAVIASTEAAGIWTIAAGIFPENTASLALHRAAGFRVVGTRERIGCQHGRWRDVLLIERRSSVAGSGRCV